MRKNLLKKLVAVVATTAMALTAILANPTEAKAATEKEIYLQVEEDDAYGIGLWNGYSGLTVNAEYMESSDWIYAFTKVEDGLYKVSVTTDGTVSLVGLQIYKTTKDGEIAKSDPEWSADGGAFNTALQTALNSTDTVVTISGYDSVAWNFSSVVASTPQAETTTTAGAADETTTVGGAGETTTAATGTTTGTPDTGDSTMVALYLAVAVLGAVVVLNKKRVNE